MKVIEVFKKHNIRFIQEYEEESYDIKTRVYQFFGSEYDLIQTYELLKLYEFNVGGGRRVYSKRDVYLNNDSIQAKIIGENWMEVVNEIVIYPQR